MENIIGDYEFSVLPFEVDYRGKLTMPHIINYILDSASCHADKFGFGIEMANRNNCNWVVTRLAIEMEEYPKLGEKIHVQTWVESIMRMFSMRNFAFISADGRTLGHARSVWALINTETRTAQDLSSIVSPSMFLNKECPIERIRKIKNAGTETVETFRVKYSDIDLNQHMNSSKYVEHITDTFTLHKFSKRDIKRLEIEFIQEALFDEAISIQKLKLPNNEYIFSLKNDKKETISKGSIIFGEQEFSQPYTINTK